MHIGFLDESGTPSSASQGRYFTIALLVVEDPRTIEKLVRRTRRLLHRRARSSELKAARSHPSVIRRLLTGLAAADCEIYVTVVDNQGVSAQECEAIYRTAVAYTVEHHPRVSLCLDKRYTNRAQQMLLEQAMREAIAHVPMQVVLIEQQDSWAVPGLQAVDFVAWAFGQKYGLGDDWAARIIADKVIVEETVRGSKIAAWPGCR
jgi:hypothetical protein